MAYDIKVAVLKPEEGYDKIASNYSSYHKHLDSFDQGMFLRFLPRDHSSFDILDLGAGDGRMHKFFRSYKSYTACDISQKLLEKHPSWPKIHKLIHNMEKPLPFQDDTFDVVLSFFVLEHLEHKESLEQVFDEVYRSIKVWGTFIVGHFIQRRAVIFKDKKAKFKIKRNNRRKDEIVDAAEKSLFSVHMQEIFEKDTLLGWLFICKKT